MTAAAAVSAISTIVAALVAGWFAWLARRASAHGPESVAGGYSKLVTDMRTQQEGLMARVAHLERERLKMRQQQETERKELNQRIEHLARQVRWLMNHVSEDRRTLFKEMFGEIEDEE